MIVLIAGLVVFLGVHLVPTLPRLRSDLMSSLGAGPYKIAFSLLSALGLGLIIWGYGAAPAEPRAFDPVVAVQHAARHIVPIAILLLVAANTRSHIRRWVQHPQLIGVLIWATVHLLSNGSVRATILFGSFLAFALVDLISSIRRHAVKEFQPSVLHDVIVLVGGVALTLAIMLFHTNLFGVPIPH